MSSHRIDRVRGARIPESRSPMDVVVTSPQKRSPALVPEITTSRSHLRAPISSPADHSSESRSAIRDGDSPIIRPVMKTSRSMSNEGDARPSGLPRFAGNLPSHRRPSAPNLTNNGPEISRGSSIADKQLATVPVDSGAGTSKASKNRPRNVIRRKANFRRQNDDHESTMGLSNGGAEIGTVASRSGNTTSSEHGMEIPAPNVQITSLLEKSTSTKLPRAKTPKAVENGPLQQIPKEFIGLRTVINTSNLPPPPTPVFTSASSPSTRYSESPGMWSSRGSTPTSLSSYSPGITQPAANSYRFKQQSPTNLRQTAGLRMTTSPISQTDCEEPTILGPIATDFYTPPEKLQVFPVQRANENSMFLASQASEKPLAKSQSPQKPYPETGNAGNGSDSEISNSGVPFKPRRPSRDGTDKLEQAVSPVIRSNLPALRIPAAHARRISADKVSVQERLRVIPVTSAATSMESLQSNGSTHIPSRNDTTTQIPRKAARTLVKPPKEPKISASTNSSNKFNLFSKKSKAELSSSTSNATEKTSRKGPAAGTGHEGYGRYAQRGRKSSVGSGNSIRTRSTSTSGGISIASTKGLNHQGPDIDDFLRQRLEPVIINGGGMHREQLFRPQSGQSLSTMSATSASGSSTFNGGPVMGGYSSESLTSMLDQTTPAARNLTSDTSLPSQVRNTQQTKPKMARNESATSQVSSHQMDSASETQEILEVGQDAKFSALPSISKVTSNSSSTTSPKTTATKTSRRWNFFHRSQKNEEKKESQVPIGITSTETQLHAHVAPFPKIRPVAHYALVDADSDSLEDILHRVEDSPPSDDEAFLQALPEQPTESALNIRHGTSVLLPSPPTAWKEFTNEGVSHLQNRPSSPKVFFRKDDESSAKDTKRRSRLAPVGRIPRVVSTRDRNRDHKPPLQSYSRPFSRSEAPSLTITASPPADMQATCNRSKLNVEVNPISQGPFSPSLSALEPFSAPVLSESAQLMSSAYSANEFLRFPRKQSEVSNSTSEGDSILATVASLSMGSNTNAYEEEEWPEYDDLLDAMMGPKGKSEQNHVTSGPFDLAKKASKTLQAEISGSDVTSRMPTASDALYVEASTSPDRSSDASVRLRRSKIAAALHSPSPQVSHSELNAGDSNHNPSPSDVSPAEMKRESRSDRLQSSTPTPTNTPDFETTRRRNTMLFDMAERMREGAAAQTNLRSASLMTSRWLSFGRVLFSPAHNRIQKSESECILIIDGLGNDDWSYYCALTYPNASIYNLSIRSGSSSSSPHPDAWKPPANHHLVHHVNNVDAAFPFPKGFFSACIIRFPSAASEDGQRHILSECKRVLRSGGYLEMSVLDLDLVNVGSKTRKAIRNLKEKIYVADPSISLKPASDNFQRLLGICGYDNLNRCMVSIPVAGMIGGSTASSNSTSEIPSAGTGFSSQPSEALSSASHPHARTPSDEAEPSLGDLLSDPSPSASNDKSITKVVARVGRWWYTRSYEIPVLSDPTTDQSIWTDKRILRECQKRGTGFRLLIAYAQKPCEKRRTVSL